MTVFLIPTGAITAAVVLTVLVRYVPRLIRLVVMDVKDKRHDKRTAKSMFGPRSLWLAAEDVPPNELLTDEQRTELGGIHYGCFDLWRDGDACCAECWPVLDAWQESRRAAA